MTQATKVDKRSSSTLKNPPLIEAVFELRWELQAIPNSQARKDPAYPIVYGRLYDRLSRDYTHLEDLPSTQAHPDATPYVVRHRIRKEAAGYPLIQVGPGILTINDAKGYSWPLFRAEVARVLKAFLEFFPKGPSPLNLLKTELRYINAYDYKSDEISPLTFLKEKLHTEIAVGIDVEGSQPEGVALNLGYSLKKPIGQGVMSWSVGQVEGKTAILQQTLISSLGDHTPQGIEELEAWLEEAHGTASSWFTQMCRGELMKSFV